jgi:hypothetical protein
MISRIWATKQVSADRARKESIIWTHVSANDRADMIVIGGLRYVFEVRVSRGRREY